jgi:hypothetical protein
MWWWDRRWRRFFEDIEREIEEMERMFQREFA